jgi:hypothetical protein
LFSPYLLSPFCSELITPNFSSRLLPSYEL